MKRLADKRQESRAGRRSGLLRLLVRYVHHYAVARGGTQRVAARRGDRVQPILIVMRMLRTQLHVVLIDHDPMELMVVMMVMVLAMMRLVMVFVLVVLLVVMIAVVVIIIIVVAIHITVMTIARVAGNAQRAIDRPAASAGLIIDRDFGQLVIGRPENRRLRCHAADRRRLVHDAYRGGGRVVGLRALRHG